MRKIFVKVAPHAIAVFLLFCISAAFYSPSVIKGERMKQGDIQNFKIIQNTTYYALIKIIFHNCIPSFAYTVN